MSGARRIFWVVGLWIIAIIIFGAGCVDCFSEKYIVTTSEDLNSTTGNQRAIPHDVQLRHPGIESNTPKPYILYQIKNRAGLIVGYRMSVDSVSCREDVCQISSVTMTWDALGDYTGYSVTDGVALEKVTVSDNDRNGEKAPYKAVPFTATDNSHLDQILRNKDSVLKTLEFRNLVTVRDGQKLDGVTGATPLSVQEAVVEGAALTCYHLWHWANGDVQNVARKLTLNGCDENQLSNFLASDKPHYVCFALENLREKNLVSAGWVEKVNKAMLSGTREQTRLGYAYLLETAPEKGAFYDNLSRVFLHSNSASRVHILTLLSVEKDIPDSLFESIAVTIPTMKRYSEVHLLLNLMDKHDCVSEHIVSKTSDALDNPNFFISRRAYWYLEKKDVNEGIKTRLQNFQKKCVAEGRCL